MLGPCFAIHYFVPFLVLQTSRWQKVASCFTFTVFLMSCGCNCSLSLPHGAMIWSALCDCRIT